MPLNSSEYKICFVISNIKLGGAERQFVKIINNLDSNIFEIDLLLYSFNGKIPFYINKDININSISNSRYSRFKIFKIMQSLLVLRKYFKKNKYDIIQTTLFMNSLILRLALSKSYENKVIGMIRTSSYKWWQYLVEFILIKRSYLITNSNFVYEKLTNIQKFKYKIYYISNGFEIVDDNYLTKEKRNIIISTVGRFSNEKNQIFLINAFEKLNNNLHKLVLFGSVGNAYDKINDYIIKNKLQNRVELKLDENDPMKIYKNIDIFVLPSKYEGFPNTLYEAMISCKICLISESANLDSHIIDGYNGYVFKLDSIDGLVSKINFIIEQFNSDEINKIRKNAYSCVKNNYSIDKIISEYTDLYKNIILN